MSDNTNGTCVHIICDKDQPISLFKYNGKIYASNLFKLHSERGYPLSDSVNQCIKRGWIPCTQQFIADAICGGWTKERAESVVRESRVDFI